MELFNKLIAVLAIIMLLLGIALIAGFIITGMWHCLLLAAMAIGMAGIWYYDDYSNDK